jgi:hypothetical protein
LLCALYPLAVIALSILAFAPMLVTNLRLTLLRSFTPLSALIFLCGTIHLGMLFRVERWTPTLKVLLAGGFVAGLCCLSTYSLAARMVAPAVAEYNFIRSSLSEGIRSGVAPTNVRAIIPRRTRVFVTDEVDHMSIEFAQDIEPMIRTIGFDLGLRLGNVSASFPGEPFEREGSLILDFAELSKIGMWKAVSPSSAWLTISPLNQNPARPFAFVGELRVEVKSHGARDVEVRFTSDGTAPTLQSRRIQHSFSLTKSTILKAAPFLDGVPAGPAVQAEFRRLDEGGAVAIGPKRGGDRAERIQVTVQPGRHLVLLVNDGNDEIDYDQADWADAVFECSSGAVYLSQLKPELSKQDWGSLANDRNLFGGSIRINGQAFQHGLAVNANAELVYEVPQGCTSFVAWLGVDDAAGRKGSVIFTAGSR